MGLCLHMSKNMVYGWIFGRYVGDGGLQDCHKGKFAMMGLCLHMSKNGVYGWIFRCSLDGSWRWVGSRISRWIFR